MRQINVNTLRQWLEDGTPVNVLDVRSSEDRSEWSIPGSIHVDAYQALKAQNPNALASLDLPTDVPVVTVCGRGRVSQVAAKQLQNLGFNAFSLEGGMRAWSLAWNSAQVTISSPPTCVLQLRRTGKGCLSHLIGSHRSAVVIDASLPTEVYLNLAEQHDWRISHVVETHIHADHLSRSKILAEVAGASLLLPAQHRAAFLFTPVADGNTVQFGQARLKAIWTPGHTMESTCYLLNDDALFTGDTLFLSSVGRPDLHADLAETRERARYLYHSIENLHRLSPEVLIFPGHASEPIAFDGKAIYSHLGEVFRLLATQYSSEQEFVQRLMSRIPPTPANYERIVKLNEAGTLPEGDPTELEAGANRCAVL